ncbi:MAG: Rid family hydrolase [Phycisphaerales bacterium]
MKYARIRALATVGLAASLVACESGPPTSGVTHIKSDTALGPYSGAVMVDRFIFLSGKIGDPSLSFIDESHEAIDAVEEELGRSGASLDDVVSVTVYLTDLENYSLFNEIYSSRFPAPHPARACVEVAELPGGARVEIQAVAVRR